MDSSSTTDTVRVMARFRPPSFHQAKTRGLGFDNRAVGLSSPPSIGKMVLPKKPATFSSAQFAKALASPPGTPAGSPSLDDAFYLDFVDNKTVDIRSPAEMKATQTKKFPGYTLDRVFPPSATQQDVFNDVAAATVQDILVGFNGTIFAYGQTGAGKSHSMFGDRSSKDMNDKGIIPRCAAALFEGIQAMEDVEEVVISMSFLEIYRENIKDLLNPKNTSLRLRETPSGEVYVQGITEEFVASALEIMDLVAVGERSRTIACTNMNETSSRSHAVLLITVKQTAHDQSVKVGKLYLADLAGSERVGLTGATGQTLEEAKNINQSLSALGNCISALTEKRRQHIPYRDSVLTYLLKDSLGGNSKTTMLVCCSSESFNAAESITTLKFAMRLKRMRNVPKINKQRSVAELEAMVLHLRTELAVATTHNAYLRGLLIDLEKVASTTPHMATAIAHRRSSLARIVSGDVGMAVGSTSTSTSTTLIAGGGSSALLAAVRRQSLAPLSPSSSNGRRNDRVCMPESVDSTVDRLRDAAARMVRRMSTVGALDGTLVHTPSRLGQTQPPDNSEAESKAEADADDNDDMASPWGDDDDIIYNPQEGSDVEDHSQEKVEVEVKALPADETLHIDTPVSSSEQQSDGIVSSMELIKLRKELEAAKAELAQRENEFELRDIAYQSEASRYQESLAVVSVKLQEVLAQKAAFGDDVKLLQAQLRELQEEKESLIKKQLFEAEIDPSSSASSEEENIASEAVALDAVANSHADKEEEEKEKEQEKRESEDLRNKVAELVKKNSRLEDQIKSMRETWTAYLDLVVESQRTAMQQQQQQQEQERKGPKIVKPIRSSVRSVLGSISSRFSSSTAGVSPSTPSAHATSNSHAQSPSYNPPVTPARAAAKSTASQSPSEPYSTSALSVPSPLASDQATRRSSLALAVPIRDTVSGGVVSSISGLAVDASVATGTASRISTSGFEGGIIRCGFLWRKSTAFLSRAWKKSLFVLRSSMREGTRLEFYKIEPLVPLSHITLVDNVCRVYQAPAATIPGALPSSSSSVTSASSSSLSSSGSPFTVAPRKGCVKITSLSSVRAINTPPAASSGGSEYVDADGMTLAAAGAEHKYQFEVMTGKKEVFVMSVDVESERDVWIELIAYVTTQIDTEGKPHISSPTALREAQAELLLRSALTRHSIDGNALAPGLADTLSSPTSKGTTSKFFQSPSSSQHISSSASSTPSTTPSSTPLLGASSAPFPGSVATHFLSSSSSTSSTSPHTSSSSAIAEESSAVAAAQVLDAVPEELPTDLSIVNRNN